MRRKAAVIGLTSMCSNWRPGAVTVPSFRPFVWGYVAMAVLRTVVLVVVAMAGPPEGVVSVDGVMVTSWQCMVAARSAMGSMSLRAARVRVQCSKGLGQ